MNSGQHVSDSQAAVTAKRRPLLLAACFGLVTAIVWIRCFEAQRVTLTSLVLLAIWLVWARRAVPRSALALVMITCPLVSAPAYAAAEMAWAYAHGTARVSFALADDPMFEANFAPRVEDRNLDRVYRAFWSRDYRCTAEPFDPWDICGTFIDVWGTWSTLLPRAVASRTFDLLFHLFGPMPGAYVGPYPRKQEALTAIELNATTVDAAGWSRRRLTVAGRELLLPPKIRGWEAGPKSLPVTVALVAGTCLLVHEKDDSYEYIRLIDLHGFGLFATYRYPKQEGDR